MQGQEEKETVGPRYRKRGAKRRKASAIAPAEEASGAKEEKSKRYCPSRGRHKAVTCMPRNLSVEKWLGMCYTHFYIAKLREY